MQHETLTQPCDPLPRSTPGADELTPQLGRDLEVLLRREHVILAKFSDSILADDANKLSALLKKFSGQSRPLKYLRCLGFDHCNPGMVEVLAEHGLAAAIEIKRQGLKIKNRVLDGSREGTFKFSSNPGGGANNQRFTEYTKELVGEWHPETIAAKIRGLDDENVPMRRSLLLKFLKEASEAGNMEVGLWYVIGLRDGKFGLGKDADEAGKLFDKVMESGHYSPLSRKLAIEYGRITDAPDTEELNSARREYATATETIVSENSDPQERKVALRKAGRHLFVGNEFDYLP